MRYKARLSRHQIPVTFSTIKVDVARICRFKSRKVIEVRGSLVLNIANNIENDIDFPIKNEKVAGGDDHVNARVWFIWRQEKNPKVEKLGYWMSRENAFLRDRTMLMVIISETKNCNGILKYLMGLNSTGPNAAFISLISWIQRRFLLKSW